MTHELDERVAKLIDRARAIKDLGERAAFLRQECGRDEELQRAVVSNRELKALSAATGTFGDSLASSEPQGEGSAAAEPLTKSESIVETPGDNSIGLISTLFHEPGSDAVAGPRRLGKYQLLGAIGQGGMGVVYQGLDPDLKREVALKVQRQPNDEALTARFKAEAQAVAVLDDHPNIVRIHDLQVDHDPPFIVMELLQGIDLARLVGRNGPARPEVAIGLIIQAAQGLSFAHERGIVHRDIKPQNLFLTRQGTLKLLDLGLAKLPVEAEHGSTEQLNLESDSQAGGSIEYLSPEQSRSLADATPRSDIYSLGCTIYFLLTGTPPFRADNRAETIAAHRTSRRPSLTARLGQSAAIARLDRLVLRMMAIEPTERPGSMGLFRKDRGRLWPASYQASRDGTGCGSGNARSCGSRGRST